MWAYEDVQIGEHKASEWGLMLQKAVIPQPAVKTKYVDVPGCDGSLDFTEAFGAVFYKDRTKVKLVFDYVGDYSRFQAMVETVANAIHGKKKKVILGYDSGYYYLGRLEVDPQKTDEIVGTVTLTGTFDPYKYKLQQTVRSFSVSSARTVTLQNLYRPVVPVITVTGEVSVGSLTLSAGTLQIPELVLAPGDNAVSLSGSGTITFTYQEATL